MHSFSPSACLSHSIFVWDMFLQEWLIFRLTNIYIYICIIYTHYRLKEKNIEDRQQPRFGHLFMSGAKPGGIYVARSWHEVVIRNSSSPKSLVFVSHIISPLYSVTWLVKRFFVDDFWQEVRGEGQSKKALQRILCRPFALVWRKTPGTDKKSNPFQPIRKWHPEELVLGDVATIASVHVLQDSASEVSVRCNLGPRTAEFRARVTFQF